MVAKLPNLLLRGVFGLRRRRKQMRKTSFFVLMLFLCLPSFTIGEAKKPIITSTWLWNTYEIVTNEDEVLLFLQQQHVTDLYLQINRDIEISVYQRFIEKASAIGVKVHALDGDPNWATRHGYKLYEPLLHWLRHYDNISIEGQRFSGIHLDVEPYLLTDWNRNQKATIEFYQRFVLDFQKLAKDLELEFALDIPFWFDEIHYNNKKYGRGLLSEWLIDQTDLVTIMAYRNFALGKNGIIDLVKTEIDYASESGKKIVIAVETEPSHEGSHISFSDITTLEQEVEKVMDHYKQSSSFRGVAIHHYNSWKQLIK